MPSLIGLLSYAAAFGRRIRQLNAETNGLGTQAVQELAVYLASLWCAFKRLDVNGAADAAFGALIELADKK